MGEGTNAQTRREIEMDTRKYYNITHRYHAVLNPISSEKVDDIIALLKLAPGSRVVDIACGKGEILVLLAERYDITGIGVDISPYCIGAAREKHRERCPQARLEFLEMDGAKYQADLGLFSLSMCIGATWVYGGYRGTLRALKEMTLPGGLVLVGEVFFQKEPVDEYLVAAGFQRDSYGTHYDNVLAGQDEGLTPLYTVVSSQDEWDRYEALQWYAAAEYGLANPADPDVEELLSRDAQDREVYLRWQRDTLGWGLYLFQLRPSR